MAKWWQERVVYQIYPRSYQDTNGDGIGDIPGIIMHLDELKDLGVGILWLSPVYCSPNADNGYDISDYRNINPEYGTMQDMDTLLAEAGKRDIKIIMDLVINHTSDRHEWFQKSKDKNSPYRDYYIWRPGKGGKAPNNWTGFFAGNCWEYDAQSGEYYLHLFTQNQPDLNYYNPKVLDEVKDIMRFWLDKGVSGFRCDVINILYKSSLEDGKKRLALTGIEYYLSQEGTHEILRTLRREVLDHYDCFTVGETVFITPQMGKDLCDRDRRELDMLFSFEHMETDQYFVKWFKRKFNPKMFGKTIAKWQNALEWNANYLENHDQTRSVSRFGDEGVYWAESAKMLGTLLLTLRGTPYIYEGQEIGMTNFDFTDMDQIQDIESHNVYRFAKKLHFTEKFIWKMMKACSRDNARTPMQWNTGANAGFSTGKPWLKVNANFSRINMQSQINDPDSIRSYYKKLIAMRSQSNVLLSGDFQLVRTTRNVFIYDRTLEGKSLRVLLNFTGKPQKANCSGKVVISNYGREEYDGVLKPYEAAVLDLIK